MRERVSEVLTFFLIFSFCLFSYILIKIWHNFTRQFLVDIKVLTDNMVIERYVKNSLLLWEKPIVNYLGNIEELDTYLEKLDMRRMKRGVQITVTVRKPVACVQLKDDMNLYTLVSKDGYILEMDENIPSEKFPILYGLSYEYKVGMRIKNPEIVKFLNEISNLKPSVVNFIDGFDHEKMLVYMRKGIVMKVNEWPNFFENAAVIEDLVKTLPRGSMLQLLSGGKLLLLSRER